MAMYHTSMDHDHRQHPAAHPVNQAFASSSHAQSWPRQAAAAAAAAPPDFEPMQPEPRFHNPHDRPFDQRSHAVNRYEPMESHQHYSWPQQGHAASSASDAVPASPPGTCSVSSSPREDCYGWMNAVESSERKVCHCGKAFRRPSDLA
ncbi:hypothetical protein AK830_g9594 [Neonectria ditissima]|uniref:Uncharacterized protein n=1 Tax=Neonectria ditissima TaxID=78410 RepID=A0A0P7AHQ9_9HYPO|nr:hypothetical protein AK830_g9594 [Neonectria ditissima]